MTIAHSYNNSHRAIAFILISILSFVLVACGASSSAEPTAAPSAPTVAPTIAPTPEPVTPVTASEPTTATIITEPVATEPSVTEPSVTEPSVTEPSVTEPSVTEPVTETTQLSFTPATYIDESAGFELDYPADWTLDPSSQIGVRGGQALLLSPGTTLETVADGGTRVSITTYVWDPKNDLDAYVAQRKVAWDASGFAITREEQWQLADGRTAYVFTVNTPEVPTFTLFTTVGEDYLQIAGDGNQALVEEIARTLRPIN